MQTGSHRLTYHKHFTPLDGQLKDTRHFAYGDSLTARTINGVYLETAKVLETLEQESEDEGTEKYTVVPEMRNNFICSEIPRE